MTWKNIFANKISWAAAGALAVAVLVLGTGYLVQKKGLVSLNLNGISFEQEFKKVALKDNAFGSLVGEESAQGALGRGGGGGGNASAPSSADAKAIAPFYGYKYVYKGEPLELKNSTVEVLRRIGFDVDASGLGRMLKTFGMGAVDMNSFGSLKIQNINLTSQDNLGYIISASPQDGQIYISENYLLWPQPYANCRDANCYEQMRIKISDVLPDSEILKIADEFASAHGLNLSSYGPGEVMNEWRLNYEKTEDKSQFYIPDVATVLYPLRLNGQNVYDEGGNKTGLSISVNLREKRASGAGNITSQKYEASNYAAETDTAKIFKIAERGGYWNYYPESANLMEIEIGTPKIEYVSMYRSADGKSSYLFVPALIFPVIGEINPNYYSAKSVVVPLAKELIEQRGDVWIMGGAGGAEMPAAAK